MSLLLFSGTDGGLVVAYGGDAAVVYEPTSLAGGEPVGPQTFSVAYGGDAAVSYALPGIITTGNDTLVVPYGGDAAAGYPAHLFITVGGVTVPAGSDPDNRIRVWHYATLAELEAGDRIELDGSFGRGFTVELSGPGSWTCVLDNVDSDLTAIDYGHYIRFDLDGIAVLLGIVESIDTTLISPAEEAGEITVISGRTALAEWERSVIGPSTEPGSPLFADERRFGWMSAELLDQHWPTGRRQWRQDTLATGYEAKHGTPLGWPDPEGWWIWSTPPAGDPPLHEPGISYFRNAFTVAAATNVAIYAACDDAFEMYLDGVPIGGSGELNGWQETFRADVGLTAADHLIAIKAENFDRAAATNTAGLIVAVYALDDEGKDDTLLLRTGNADWEVTHYPEVPPGFTVGAVIRLLVEEAQADGELLGWSLGFDDAVDSAGNPWPTNEQFSFPVGLDRLSALLQLADTHIDFTIDPAAKILRAWRYGEAGVPAELPTATLIDGVGSLVLQGRS